MTDVALEAGVSQTTVSFVLGQTAGSKLPQATRDRVTEAARKLGYSLPTPCATPLPLAPMVSGTIGIMVDQLATTHDAVVAIEGARLASRNTGNILLVAQMPGDMETETRTIDALIKADISALIYMAIFTRELVAPAYLYDLKIPVVLLNCHTADYRFPAVVPSEIAGGQNATLHLITHGHRRIATITGEPWQEATQDRLTGYRRALATADIPFDPELVVEGDWSTSTGYDATKTLLQLKERPTAIFCQNDRMAIGCYEALKEFGLAIPRDMSVIGYDDEEVASHLHPPLTTSVLPHRAMGEWAIERLGLPFTPQGNRYPITKVECPLVVRKSVSSPRHIPSHLSLANQPTR
ncbi:LacI family DNA-binding transcriptional regulator [Agrobacterium tumefaciens]|uniref:LacI family DNA-binding transcriptional regulator n=1 Tax=Rhizobium/Agrobacterium group TaxID=227290 RepID=UPI001572E5EE|nr:LacI family DNA-binding transcriptional regulator [Agrobacterium tumefaciens]NTA83798.1 substrate-binding domain-containing protein [Agrobacterium tumefaciens]